MQAFLRGISACEGDIGLDSLYHESWMRQMSTLRELDNIVGRLQKCPKNLVRAEIDMFYRQLETSGEISVVLHDIVERNGRELGAKVASIIGDVRNSNWSDLAFASTPSLRAVVGYQACQVLLAEQHTMRFANAVQGIGQFYWKYQGGWGGDPVGGLSAA